jgi:ribonuclease HI
MIHIYCDGSILKNPGGVGGYAAIIVYRNREVEIAGFELDTTNNRMELQAAIQAIRRIKREGRKLHVVSDSQYVILGASQWLTNWVQNGWRNSNMRPTVNKDLWKTVIELKKKHQITWEWVRGHDGHHFNERADVLAGIAARTRTKHLKKITKRRE